ALAMRIGCRHIPGGGPVAVKQRLDSLGNLEPTVLEQQLRAIAGDRAGVGIVDDLELGHLVYVILHGALLLQDLYASERVGSIYSGDPKALARTLLSPVLADPDRPELDALARAGR